MKCYIFGDGISPFEDWLVDLQPVARTKVTTALTRIEQSNFSNMKSVGQGVLEYRIDWGPGYRIYFGRVGDVVGHSFVWRNEGAATARYRGGKKLLVRLQTAAQRLMELGDGVDERLERFTSRADCR